ncbi:MAG TPA: SDR family oxidoreductase [Kiloniellaceae bacterium]|nr:SDR family oxidoreductase [Kiloniellaceae bacterium]
MTHAAPSRHPDDYPRVALVTGAAVRVGRALALDLAAKGWAVAVHHNRSSEAAADLVAAIESAGGKAVALAADFTEEAESAGLVDRVAAALGPPGLLINNASTFEQDLVENVTRESWDRHLEPNLRAPFLLCQSFAANLGAAAGGLIVNILDERVLNLRSDYVSYSLSKAGLWALTQSLAVALAPRIRVNAIGPGYTLPERGGTQADFDAATARLPLGRGTTPAEICEALHFLLACKSITGQMIVLDGGHHLAGRRRNEGL